MPPPSAELAARVPWLPPGAAGLAHLARGRPGGDPALAVLLARFDGDDAAALRFARDHLVSVTPADPAAYAAALASPKPSLGRLALALLGITGDAAVESSVTRRLARRWNVSPHVEPCESPPWQSPADAPFLHELIELAIERHADDSAAVVLRLEADVDDLHGELDTLRATMDAEIERRKLEAVAEFAAGAGHEINNPLAVISGQAQLLLQRETEPLKQQALKTITQQSRRVHGLITDLMQFARPSTPRPEPLDTLAIVTNAVKGLGDVQIVGDGGPVMADRKHATRIVAAVVRNAVESGGPVRVLVEAGRVVVEDGGPGPSAEARRHLFDPFFSGRSAGRGPGLGLSAAWALARLAGGAVRYAPTAECVGRFEIEWPSVRAGPERLSA